MSEWLERLRTLVLSPVLTADRSGRSDSYLLTRPIGPSGPNGPGLRTEVSPEQAAWIDRADVITMVEDLFRERWHPGRIARELGLTRGEVRTILRVADRQDSADMAENYRTQRRRR